MNIYSRIDPTQILHIINRVRDIQTGRLDLIESDNRLQCAVMRIPKDMTFKPHRHKITSVGTGLVQESWVVIKGIVQVTLYDIDNTVLHTDVLEPGDVSITLNGGHNYLIMADDSIVIEYKTGPYNGVENDKIMI